ncbi:MAG TPA: lysyl oxidase family protein [Pyrinomonadaceae bacterium]
MRKLTLLFAVFIALAIFGPSTISQRTSVSRVFPVYNNGGKPDLVVDPQRFVSQMEIVDRFFAEGDCALEEKAVGGTGYRRLLRFDTVIMNSGDGDLVVGDRSDPNNPYAQFFEFAPCHGHYHIRDFSVYELLNRDRTVVVAAHKQGFCRDGLLTGQWIDITGVPKGDYIVRVTINLSNTFDEGSNRYTDALETSIHVPSPRKKVTIDDSPLLIEK